jgi:hypothetical protein
VPIYDKTKAKPAGGFQQVRKALKRFEGDVIKAEIGVYGGGQDPNGKPLPPKEYLEIDTINNTVLEVSEPLSMDISESYSFRINCSEKDNSFWVAEFLTSAEANKILLPDGLLNKHVTWKQVIKESKDKKGNVDHNFDATGMIIVSVVPIQPGNNPNSTNPPQTAGNPVQAAVVTLEAFMAIITDLAIGKTEAQFRMAVPLDVRLASNQALVQMAKAGVLTANLLKEGKLKEETVDGKVIYQKG